MTVQKLQCLERCILIVRDAKFFISLESFASKFNFAIIEIFGTVSPVF